MSATLELDQGGTVSVLVSVRGMYTMQEMQVYTRGHPLLVRCDAR